VMTSMFSFLQPYSPEKWTTIRIALESTAKTLRLCLIMLVGTVPPALLVILTVLTAGRLR
jgi:hypothetical protein